MSLNVVYFCVRETKTKDMPFGEIVKTRPKKSSAWKKKKINSCKFVCTLLWYNRKIHELKPNVVLIFRVFFFLFSFISVETTIWMKKMFCRSIEKYEIIAREYAIEDLCLSLSYKEDKIPNSTEIWPSFVSVKNMRKRIHFSRNI